MTEIWLRPNRRALLFGMVVPAIVVGLGGAVLGGGLAGALAAWLRWLIGMLMVSGGGAILIGLAAQILRPRIGYADRCVLFYLRGGPPVRTPVEVVEAFFLGQGPARLPGKPTRDPETVNLLARLAERATEWHHVEVKPALGQWCDGYVTIRGTWAEPLTDELARGLNRRLAEAKQTE